jgi:hypothetical protein
MATTGKAADIDAAVAEVHGVIQRVQAEDLAAGLVARHVVPQVTRTEMPFAFLESKEWENTLAWAEALDRSDSRLASLAGAQALFAELAHVAPYDTRANDGWEAIIGIAIAAQAFDFLTNSKFKLEAIQLRMREVLLRDSMIERTIWGVYGLRLTVPIRVGERSWLLPADEQRRSYVAVPGQPGYPLIHAHCYLVSDRLASSDDLRTGKRDPLPTRLISSLRAVGRADLRAMGPWFETVVMLPSRFAGFTTQIQRPTLPLGYWIPNDDFDITQALADEAASLDAMLSAEPPKGLKPIRSFASTRDQPPQHDVISQRCA